MLVSIEHLKLTNIYTLQNFHRLLQVQLAWETNVSNFACTKTAYWGSGLTQCRCHLADLFGSILSIADPPPAFHNTVSVSTFHRETS